MFAVPFPKDAQSPELDAIATGPDGNVYFTADYRGAKQQQRSFILRPDHGPGSYPADRTIGVYVVVNVPR